LNQESLEKTVGLEADGKLKESLFVMNYDPTAQIDPFKDNKMKLA